MAAYTVRRLAQAVFVLWAAYTLSFAVLYLLPGDPVTVMAAGGGDSTSVTPEQLASLRTRYGLDRPVAEQYATGLGHALRGDFGASVHSGEPVSRMITDAFPATLELTAATLALALPLGAGVALSGTYTRRRWLRQLLLSLPSAGVAAPTFWVGLVLIQLVSFRWGLLPAFGDEGAASLLLPAVTLSLPAAALVAQVFAKSLRTALAEPYIETAAAKGASRLRIHFAHAARNAALAPLTVAGVLVGHVLAGSVVVETVFSRAGIGRLTATAVTSQDIPVVQGLVVFGACAFVLANLAVDLLHPLLDPRIATAGPTAVTP
ncbi:ABC transporter permease [Streptomyces sp. NBC_00876]|uniref:ABC transporter permease n=1 Tax=Streptomyces sp. NBC_00876 TaxID=2975853 RepID=UPI0038643BB6|nr:ABC transporter permease [Streptomyces sp. NBC_00876]